METSGHEPSPHEGEETVDEQQDPRAGQQQPDAVGAETAPLNPQPQEVAPEGVPSEEAVGEQPPQQTAPVTDPENLPNEEATQQAASEAVEQREEAQQQQADQEAEQAGVEGEGSVLVGTATEQAPGVGGIGDHPAPAAMVDPESGEVRVAGQPPHAAAMVAPTEDADVQAGGDVTDEENLEKLNAVQEPEQVETERPDIGTE